MPESKSRKKPAYVPPPAPHVNKTNPQWLVPTMLSLMVVGLLWIGDFSVEWPVMLVPVVWALVAVRPRRER